MSHFKTLIKTLQKSFWTIPGLGIGGCLVLNLFFSFLECSYDPILKDELSSQIVLLYFAMNLSFFTLVPVFVSHIQNVLINKSSNPELTQAIEYQTNLTDDYCQGFLPWCAILIVCTIVFLLCPCERFFWVISAFEMSILIVNTIFGVVVLQFSWTKEVSINLQKNKK